MSQRERKQSKISRCLRAPAKVLAKAREFYVRGITEWAARLSGSSVIGCPNGQTSSMRRTLGGTAVSAPFYCNEEDLRDLMRARSTRNHMLGVTKVDEPPEQKPRLGRPAARQKRSYSTAAIGKIEEEEEEECDFEEKEKVVVQPTRSRSNNYAVPIPKVRAATLVLSKQS